MGLCIESVEAIVNGSLESLLHVILKCDTYFCQLVMINSNGLFIEDGVVKVDVTSSLAYDETTNILWAVRSKSTLS